MGAQLHRSSLHPRRLRRVWRLWYDTCHSSCWRSMTRLTECVDYFEWYQGAWVGGVLRPMEWKSSQYAPILTWQHSAWGVGV